MHHDARPGTVAREASPDFAAFFRAEYTRLFGSMTLVTGDAAVAEDIAQEAMARAYERWDMVGAMESPIGYVYRTAFNLHRSGLRRLARSARMLAGAVPRVEEADATERRLDARRAVAALPRAQREALVLVVWLELTAGEAGRILGIDAASVRGRIHRARANLRARMGGDDG